MFLNNLPTLRDKIRIETLDGDTESRDRTRIRRQASVILTNMDTLHAAILPYYRGWMDFLKNLKLVVVDGSFLLSMRLNSNN